ncbi:MalY/PatB family protein [Actinomyces mediterranea]|uniref:MalY/PatB family protein n=1 Tax=Actinomyces mediterranea TaxID=1871028 RepID=UPI00097139E1|nr:MalY/PatB family protein [Actinomyces mediterranea]
MPSPFDALFDQPVNRRGIGSYAWNIDDGELPMWVADMDFTTAPAIIDAIGARLQNGTFGYSIIPDSFAQSVRSWWQRRHDVDFPEGSIIFSSGVIPIISSAVRSLTNVAEYVLIQPPVYNMFYNSIANNGRRIMSSPLKEQYGEYSMDWKDLEAALSHPQCTLMILCNPHNPTGTAWDAPTLARLGDLCAANGVTVLSDEIHCDVMAPGKRHTPFAAASPTCRDIAVTCGSPSKAFNIAGLHAAYCIVENPRLRARVERGLNTDEVAEPNAFAVGALVAAYNEGEEWLDAACAYIDANKREAVADINEHCSGAHALDSEATYLVWVDCSGFMRERGFEDSKELASHIRKTTGLVLSPGSIYGEPGRTFIRMNVATCKERLRDGLQRFARALA